MGNKEIDEYNVSFHFFITSVVTKLHPFTKYTNYSHDLPILEVTRLYKEGQNPQQNHLMHDGESISISKISTLTLNRYFEISFTNFYHIMPLI